MPYDVTSRSFFKIARLKQDVQTSFCKTKLQTGHVHSVDEVLWYSDFHRADISLQ